MSPPSSPSNFPTQIHQYLHRIPPWNLHQTLRRRIQRPPAHLPPPIARHAIFRGRVIYTTNNKIVNVEVTRLAPHRKYKRRVRKKKKFRAHDPANQFQIGDIVQLENCKLISKKKNVSCDSGYKKECVEEGDGGGWDSGRV